MLELNETLLVQDYLKFTTKPVPHNLWLAGFEPRHTPDSWVAEGADRDDIEEILLKRI